MNAITNPKAEYLLEAGLDVLHSESKEWLSELDFLKQELRFFLHLLDSKKLPDGKEQQRQRIFSNMDQLATTVVSEVEAEVKAHEKDLSEVLRKEFSEDASYRRKHAQLNQKMSKLDNDVRTLKMLVFDFVEHH